MNGQILDSFKKLSGYLNNLPIEQRFKGYDPFDGLNSPLVSKSVLGNSRIIRLLWLQLIKRSPVNLRKLAFIKPGYNPQALGLFLSAYTLLYKKFEQPEDLATMHFLIEKIIEKKIEGHSGACWGYNFNWQARAFYQPIDTPMIVPTAAVFNGLLDANEILSNNKVNALALSVKDFILKDLNRTFENENFAFSYSPLDKSVVYNASLMASKILARSYYLNKDKELLTPINSSVAFCEQKQHKSGFWTYGAKPYHQWVDNFHTGYNLECISDISKYIGDNQYEESLEKGLTYYMSNFFDEEGRSKYYATKTYPIDINNPAQLLITLSALNRKEDHNKLTQRVLAWTIAKMQDKSGYFYYRHYPLYRNKINYVRWSQAWMLLGMAKYLFDDNG